jgi:hypothetical protein
MGAAMRMKRIKATANASSLERLRVRGAGPDPGFRADLRERLVAAAAAQRSARRGSGTSRR